MASESETVGERIRQIRQARGMTQDELAAAVGVKQQSIQKAEAGGGLKLDRLAAIADALDTTADVLLGRGPGDSMDFNSRSATLPDEARQRIKDLIDAEERLMGDR